MQLESNATPTVETPQQRYASLHRALERGLASDDLWKELADVSLRLGNGEEAVQCLHRIRDEAMRSALEARLVRLRLIATEPVETQSGEAAAKATNHAGIKAFSGEDGHHPGLRDHVVDALQYMLHQHMPWLVLTTTLAFPLVIGVGGFLTAGGSLLLLAAIAALPGLCVLAVVGAMGRQILLASSEGMSDVPTLPDFGVLVADGRRFLIDAGLVLGTLIAPPLAALALGAPLATGLPCLMVGGFFAPLAWALRQVRGDIGALSPVTVLRAFSRCGAGYLGIVGLAWLLFAPAALVTWAVFGRPIWVQLAVIGPLCVLPIFLLSRLLGTWLDTMRMQLGAVLVRSPKAPPKAKKDDTVAPARAQAVPVAPTRRTAPGRVAAAAQPTAPARTTAVAARATKPAANPRMPRRPEGLQHHYAPTPPVQSTRAPTLPEVVPSAPQIRTSHAASTPRPPAKNLETALRRTAAPSREPQARPRQQPPSKPQPVPKAPPRAIEGLGPSRPAHASAPARSAADTMPDLTNLPGAVVVSGVERLRMGAAATHKK
ncbi:MAG: hypothetical protein ABIP94_01225 [Planctomycetota bacterium]